MAWRCTFLLTLEKSHFLVNFVNMKPIKKPVLKNIWGVSILKSRILVCKFLMTIAIFCWINSSDVCNIALKYFTWSWLYFIKKGCNSFAWTWKLWWKLLVQTAYQKYSNFASRKWIVDVWKCIFEFSLKIWTQSIWLFFLSKNNGNSSADQKTYCCSYWRKTLPVWYLW